jgi:hypothetical protein
MHLLIEDVVQRMRERGRLGRWCDGEREVEL